MKFIGKILLDNKVDITDPCYNKDVWCRFTSECKPGEYFAYIKASDQGDWGIRVSEISIYKDNAKVPLKKMSNIGSIGVDAGLAGFFNNKPDFSDDEWKELCNSIRNGDAWCMYNGAFSFSGYGDGVYDVYANQEKNAFTIKFI